MNQSPKNRRALIEALGYAWQFGYTIVIPLLIFGIGGRLLDKKFGTNPWLFVAGIVVSIVISSIALTVKALAIFRRSLEQVEPPTKPEPKDQSTPPTV